MYKRGFVIFGVVSLTMGNSPLPLADGLIRHMEPIGQLRLGHAQLLSVFGDVCAEDLFVHRRHLDLMIAVEWAAGNRPAVECSLRAGKGGGQRPVRPC